MSELIHLVLIPDKILHLSVYKRFFSAGEPRWLSSVSLFSDYLPENPIRFPYSTVQYIKQALYIIFGWVQLFSQVHRS